MIEIHGRKADTLSLLVHNMWDAVVFESENKSKHYSVTHYWLNDMRNVIESATPVKLLGSTIYL